MQIPVLLPFGILLFLTTVSQGANILFFFGVSTYSHRITVWPLVEALAEKGHSVTFLQPAENKNPNPKVTEIVPKIVGGFETLDLFKNRLDYGQKGALILLYNLPSFGELVCKQILDDPETIKWINGSKFDLVIIDALYNDCGLGFAYKWGAQTAIFGTTSVFEWWPDAYGFLPDSSSIANLLYGQNIPLTFLNRVISTLSYLIFRYTKVGYLFPAIEPVLREKLNIPDMPPLADLESNTSLILINTHFSEEISRALPPLIVEVGGMHCSEKTEPLPQEMERFINEGSNGFIYVSFGSGCKLNSDEKDLTSVFFNAMKNIETRFLWKWEGDRPVNMPSNIYTAAWMPQQAILAHPKIRAFITHGGLLSMQEAVFNAVPMISFPIFADQDYNAERLNRTKRGIRLDITTVTQEELEDTITKILNDKTYSNNVKKASLIFKDRPQTPLETAVWWVEYVLRHKDTSFLRPLSISQTWYERRLLDVWGFLAAIILAILWIAFYVFKKVTLFCLKKTTCEKKIKFKKM